jgi:hypothetical protein
LAVISDILIWYSVFLVVPAVFFQKQSRPPEPENSNTVGAKTADQMNENIAGLVIFSFWMIALIAALTGSFAISLSEVARHLQVGALAFLVGCSLLFLLLSIMVSAVGASPFYRVNAILALFLAITLMTFWPGSLRLAWAAFKTGTVPQGFAVVGYILESLVSVAIFVFGIPVLAFFASVLSFECWKSASRQKITGSSIHP